MSADAAPRPWTEAPIEPGRLHRALYFVVEPDPDGEAGVYAVHEGVGSELHWVQTGTVDAPLCDCGDHIFRESLCMHALAVLIETEDPRVMRALAGFIREAAREGRLVLQVTRRPLRPSRGPYLHRAHVLSLPGVTRAPIPHRNSGDSP